MLPLGDSVVVGFLVVHGQGRPHGLPEAHRRPVRE